MDNRRSTFQRKSTSGRYIRKATNYETQLTQAVNNQKVEAQTYGNTWKKLLEDRT